VLDAPCTATGVLRRHPDIALLRQNEDVAKTQRLQREILENLWPQLADGGVLLYVTCSILKVENESQLVDFLSCHDDAMALPFKLDLAHQIPQQVGYQCLPMEAGGGDGFYYALLKKSSRT
jgi:16S rRNA (cytosine967-C5)-methyltransferase